MKALLENRPTMMIGSTEKSYAHTNPRFTVVENERLKNYATSHNLGLLGHSTHEAFKCQ